MDIPVPQGFRVTGLKCGIKRDTTREDLSMFVADRPCVAAGVYTQNQVVAAPVIVDRQRTPSDRIRVVVVNSGNANACTGVRGVEDAIEMARLAAESIGAEGQQALVLSTGIIGEPLPIEKIRAGIAQGVTQLGNDPTDLHLAARGMMTTDTVPKVAGAEFAAGGRRYLVSGVAKGAAMIGPRMATMLGLVLTDAPLAARDAQQILSDTVEETFNCISVEGHMSTNDTVLLLANGAAGGEILSGESLASFRVAVMQVCTELARAIPNDGEGATHLMEVVVSGCRTRDDARRIARSIADSPLVKTAVSGADPNWGRIVSAAGYAGVPFDPATVVLHVNRFELYREGTPVPFQAAEVSESIRSERTTLIEFDLGQGDASIRFWSCDLTAEYVHLNADYHT